MALSLDLNSDLGEGCAHDGELLSLITTANVACGFHAGDPATAFATVRTAARHGVRVGAHPSFPDWANFGRLEMARTEQQIYEDCLYQIGALEGLARAECVKLTHVKPHGALYNMACRDDAYARPVVAAAELFWLPVLGLPASRLEAACRGRCQFIREGFADRRYLPDGSLVPRSRPDAMIDSAAEAVAQVDWLVRTLGVQSVCVHGDNPHAVQFVRTLREALTAQGFALRAFA